MPSYVLLDLVRVEHADKIRKAEREQLYIAALKANRRPSALKSLLLALFNN